MNHINVKKAGFAFGATGAILYLGCMIIMVTTGRAGFIKFTNSILHGFDVSSIVRMNISIWEALIGILEIFIISWLSGACIAAIYNANLKD